MKPGGIAKQKTVESSAGAASVLMGSWRQPLRLTLHVSTRKKASLPVNAIDKVSVLHPRSPSTHFPVIYHRTKQDHSGYVSRSGRFTSHFLMWFPRGAGGMRGPLWSLSGGQCSPPTGW